MKVGVFVGSFNPLHFGHEKIIEYLLSKKIVDKIIVIATLSYWDKNIDVSLEDRINMLKTIENENVIINTTLNDKEYTYQILNELSQEDNELYLIIGADNLVNFDKWNHINDILKHYVIVIGRNNIETDKYLKNFNRNRFIIVNGLDYNISSTYIRERIKNNDYKSLKGLINNRIIEYIKEHNLYNI